MANPSGIRHTRDLKEPRDELMRLSSARSRLRTAIRLTPLLALAALAGCGMIPPEPRTEAGEAVFTLYNIVFFMGVAVFVAVEGFILYSIVRYRRRDDKLPPQTHGNNLIEIIWTAIPTVIVLILFALSTITLATVEARADDPGVEIEGHGFLWQWEFVYLDGDDNPDNDFSVIGSPAAPPAMVVPVGEAVNLTLVAEDVIHSFFVPQFLIKRDLIPVPEGDQPNTLEFTVTEVGTYSGQCAEFCGDLHADMNFTVEAMTRADFDAWLAAGIAGETPAPTAEEPAEPGETVVEISADQIAFDVREMRVPAGEPFTIRFTNLEAIIHNVSVYDGSGDGILTGDPITGPDAVIEYQVPALEAGQYEYICDFHATVPEMTGTLIAE